MGLAGIFSSGGRVETPTMDSLRIRTAACDSLRISAARLDCETQALVLHCASFRFNCSGVRLKSLCGLALSALGVSSASVRGSRSGAQKYVREGMTISVSLTFVGTKSRAASQCAVRTEAGVSCSLTILYPDCVGTLSASFAWLLLTFSTVRCTEAFGAGLLFLEPPPDLYGTFVAPSVLPVPPRAFRVIKYLLRTASLF